MQNELLGALTPQNWITELQKQKPSKQRVIGHKKGILYFYILLFLIFE